jgi:hypothetical protein
MGAYVACVHNESGRCSTMHLGMKLVIEPSSALSLAVILGSTLGGQASSAEAWRRLVQGIAERRPASEHDVVVRVLVVISGGNVELGKVGGWFTGLDI